MDWSGVQTVTKQYNWRGEHVAYRVDGTTIPCADGNSDYRAIRERIANGKCAEADPEVTSATKVFSAAGDLTGFDTNLGFIPNDPQNRLRVLLEEAAKTGKCDIGEPCAAKEVPYVETLIFCLVLDQGWKHLAGPLANRFAYQPHEHANPVQIDVRIRNLPASAEDVLPHIFSYLGVEQTLPVALQYKALQAGMIEIEIPVKVLLKLFRNELAQAPKTIEPFLADSLAQHYVRADRKESQGPDVGWLISMALDFLTNAVASVANVALQAFAQEYGGTVPGHITEDKLLRSSLTFARHADGRISLHRLHHQSEQSFGLEGSWPMGRTLLRLADENLRKQLDLAFVRSRVRQLFDAGFAMEALVVANATFEVALEWALVGAVNAQEKARNLMAAKGHSYRLELLNKVVAANTELGLDTEEFSKFMAALTESNLMRNSYLHQLVVPTQDYWKFVQLDRTVERVIRFVVDPHSSFITLGFLVGLARSAQPETVELLLKELQKLKEWNG
jgi:hypothetical protein